MTYRWIVFAVGAAVLGGAAWYFGRPEMPKEPPVETAQNSGLPQAPKELPPKLIEVIDLASAYEPIREPQSPSGIDPASFIEDAKAPSRIPYALDEHSAYRDDMIHFSGTQSRTFLLRGDIIATQIDIQPREVVPIGQLAPMPRVVPERMSSRKPTDEWYFIPSDEPFERWVFIPTSVPSTIGVSQPIPPNALIQSGLINFVPHEKLEVMPREVK